MNHFISFKSVFLFFLSCLLLSNVVAQTKKAALTVHTEKRPGSFPLVSSKKAAAILFDAKEERIVQIAAQALSNDVKAVTGIEAIVDSANNFSSYTIIIGSLGKSQLIDQLIKTGKLNTAKLQGQWECFSISVIDQPFANTKQALVITGSDARGTAFGVFHFSKMIGVHPFYWWADIVPQHKEEIYVSKGSFVSKPPSVKYRGIFINDEDWGLQPWAAKTFEPETGDIGPKTYAKVFELLLRLKANLIWPAMHPSTKAFFYYPGNVKMAADYNIMVGSSHAEPMLRNNVGEWNEKIMGHFNYITNKEKVYSYWEERVKESSGINGIYTMGMRGVHDSKMEGVKDEKEAVPLLENIITEQRHLLRKYIDTNVTSIPQVFTAYKEVLDIYDAGLQLPEDITLVWPDDNYGYIQRLNNDGEKKRSGGSGVYYHASYWGRPHDYLWLSTTHPSLVREEMMKAYQTGASTLWVLNVGDIKPLEYNMQQFLDMAYDAKPFENSAYTKKHIAGWANTIFGADASPQITKVLLQYYQLAFERRPEFMGWSQTEPTTKTNLTTYNHFFYGDEAQRRMNAYDKLEQEVKALKNKIASNRKDAFYQLIYYPVVGASLMNKKFLQHDKALLYAKQNRLSAQWHATLSKAAYDSIEKETGYYNTQLAGGKWKDMMHMKPRNLPVFQSPEFAELKINKSEVWNLAPEGFVRQDSSLIKAAKAFTLPGFDDVHKQNYFVDIFLSDEQSLSWTAVTPASWIQLSQRKGQLSPQAEKAATRIWVSIDWNKAPKEKNLDAQIVFSVGNEQKQVVVNAKRLLTKELSLYKGFVEKDGVVVIHAANFSKRYNNSFYQWQTVEDLGYTGKVLQVGSQKPQSNKPVDTTANKNNSYVEYDFYTFTAPAATVHVFTLPTHPLNNKFSMRYAVSIDDGPLRIVDFKTFGRSEEWKQNVLANRAVRKIEMPLLQAGKHKLKLVAIDPGVVLDEIRIDLGGLQKAYSVLPETKIHSAVLSGK